MRMNKDRIFSVCIILFASIMIWQTSQLRSMFALFTRDSGPRLFPYMTCTAMILCAIGKFITEGKKEAKPFLTTDGWFKTAMVFAVGAGYLLSLAYLGFLASTPIFAVLFVYVMKGGRKVSPLYAVAFGLILTFVIYFLFQNIMHVILPRGVFGISFH